MINTENFYSSYYKDTTKDKALPTASRIRFENGVVENVLLEDKEFTDAFRSSVILKTMLFNLYVTIYYNRSI